MKRTYSQIDLNERRKIGRWRMAGISIELMAARLGRQSFPLPPPGITRSGKTRS